MLFKDVAEYYDKLEAVSSRLSMIDILSEMLGKVGKEEIRQLVYITQGILAPPFDGVEIGIAEKLGEQAISIATGFDQDEVHSAFQKSGDLGTAAEQLATKTKLRKMVVQKLHISDVFDCMKEIADTSGHGSKDVKLKRLAGVISQSSALEVRYIIRFALGELRLGAGDATILEGLSKAFTGGREAKAELENAYNLCSDLGKVAEVLAQKGMKGITQFEITPFSPIRPELAEREKTFEAIMERMPGKCYVDAKYDGLRAQIHVDKKAKRVEIFSRNLERLTPMFPDIAGAVLEQMDVKNAIFEGEMISYDDQAGEFHSFQETIQRKRKHGIEEKSTEFPVRLFTFDIMYLDGESCMQDPYEERIQKLESVIKEGKTIHITQRIVAKNAKAIEKFFNKCIESGLEGIIAKEPSSTYVAGARKYSWIKMKRSYKNELSDSVDLVIIGYFLGRGSRSAFGFGGLLTAVYNEKRDMFESLTRIGTGFTEEQMGFFKAELDKIKRAKKPARVVSAIEPDVWVEPMYVVEVRADEITKSPMHMCGKEDYDNPDEPGYALRFPRIVNKGFRDKKAEDATTTKEIVEMFGLQKKSKLDDK